MSTIAIDRLAGDGATYAVLVVGPSGKLRIEPLKPPEGTVSITRLVIPADEGKPGVARISAHRLPKIPYAPGLTFPCAWNEKGNFLEVLLPTN